LSQGAKANPFIEKGSYTQHINGNEKDFRDLLAKQQKK
jgi:hypothetical protein